MSYAVDLAKEIKKRNNIQMIGNIVGTVLSVNPLRVGILANEVILSDCVITNTFKQLLTATKIIKGDRVILITDDTNQTFFVIDKVVM